MMPARDTRAALSVIKNRADFLAAAKSGFKWVAPGLILQVGAKRASELESKMSGPRYGLTATVKIGNAVVRNRARRRLRALAFETIPFHASPDRDYVLIARQTTATRAYGDLRKDIETALKKLGVWRD